MLKTYSAKFFRNLENVDGLKFKKFNFILGDNGQGKTNLIESIFISSFGKSFRYSENIDLIKFNQSGANLKLKFEDQDNLHDLEIQIGKSKLIQKLNSNLSTKSSVNEIFPVLLFAPESLSYIKNSNEERRDLIDGSLIQTHFSLRSEWSELKKISKARALILKENLRKNSFSFLDLFGSLSDQFLKSGIKWAQRRTDYLEKVEESFRSISEHLLGKENEFNFEYNISGESFFNKGAEEIDNKMRHLAQSMAPREIQSGLNLTGPQKHEFKILFNGNDSRIYCSQGQQRALILAYKMAQLVYHYQATKKYPILLLDDVFSELDRNKQERLFEYLSGLVSQVFITTTHIDFPLSFQQKAEFKKDDVVFFNVEAGKIIPNKF